jgi:hypothetical protein
MLRINHLQLSTDSCLTILHTVRTIHHMSKTAFAYLRVSGKGQVDGDGFPRQLIAIEKYSQGNGLKIRKVFREEGISGTKELENRPALQ